MTRPAPPLSAGSRSLRRKAVRRLARIAATIALLSISLAAAEAQPQRPGPGDGEWLYLLESHNTDPTREAEFNRWYDEVDIPDVLQVPGFKRARRGRVLDIVNITGKVKGEYIAIYDIETDDIEHSISELYAAAREMSARGRDSELLKVTEANYYRVMAGYVLRTERKSKDTYIAVQKILCCPDAGRQELFMQWIATEFLDRAKRSGSILKISLYKSYRKIVGENTDNKDTHFIILYESDGRDSAGILSNEYLQDRLGQSDSASRVTIEHTTTYRQIADRSQ